DPLFELHDAEALFPKLRGLSRRFVGFGIHEQTPRKRKLDNKRWVLDPPFGRSEDADDAPAVGSAAAANAVMTRGDIAARRIAAVAAAARRDSLFKLHDAEALLRRPIIDRTGILRLFAFRL